MNEKQRQELKSILVEMEDIKLRQYEMIESVNKINKSVNGTHRVV